MILEITTDDLMLEITNQFNVHMISVYRTCHYNAMNDVVLNEARLANKACYFFEKLNEDNSRKLGNVVENVNKHLMSSNHTIEDVDKAITSEVNEMFESIFLSVWRGCNEFQQLKLAERILKQSLLKLAIERKK